MRPPSLLSVGWQRAKTYLPAACAIVAMRAGLLWVLSALVYPLTGLALKLINVIIRKDFPDHLLLNEPYPGVPWQYHAKIAAEGVIVLVIGMFLGLWANLRAERQQSPQVPTPK